MQSFRSRRGQCIVSLSAALSQPVEQLLPGPASPFTLLTFCHRCVKSPLSRLPTPTDPPHFRQSQYGLGLTVVRRLPLHHHHHYYHHHHHQRASGALIPRAHLSVCSSLPDGVCVCVTYLPELSASSPYRQAELGYLPSVSQSRGFQFSSVPAVQFSSRTCISLEPAAPRGRGRSGHRCQRSVPVSGRK